MFDNTYTMSTPSQRAQDLQSSSTPQYTDAGKTKPTPKTPKKRGATASADDDVSHATKKRTPTKKATAASNVDVNTNEEGTGPVTPPKKRASPKKKNVAAANTETDNGGTNEDDVDLEPVTPKKAKRTTTKGKGSKTGNTSNTNDESGEANEKSASPTEDNGDPVEMTVKDTPRKRQAPKKELAAPRGIPGSWEEADYADKMLVTMKEKGDSWAEIRATWKEVTGLDTAPSTLPNRYNRIKVNMMRMDEADHQHLLIAKKEIEDAFATSLWANVAASMERRGAGKYPTAFLQKTFKELDAAGKTAIVAANTNDNRTGTNDTTTPATAGALPTGNSAIKEEEEDSGDADAA
ncbi:hypothetical protein BDR22DRAFT_635103 [Usnea florida]